jgi:CBS-domain-containing membrane protein
MAFAFDSLGYAKKLREVGVPQEQAEAHAEAAREFIMVELVTRQDLDTARRELQSAIDTTRRELEAALDNLGLRLTVRMGIMLAAGLTLLGAVLKLHS